MANPRVSVMMTAKELKALRKGAQDGESDSNIIRRKLNLPPMNHGGSRKPASSRPSSKR